MALSQRELHKTIPFCEAEVNLFAAESPAYSGGKKEKGKRKKEKGKRKKEKGKRKKAGLNFQTGLLI
jgi:hypothetical protein